MSSQSVMKIHHTWLWSLVLNKFDPGLLLWEYSKTIGSLDLTEEGPERSKKVKFPHISTNIYLI